MKIIINRVENLARKKGEVTTNMDKNIGMENRN